MSSLTRWRAGRDVLPRSTGGKLVAGIVALLAGIFGYHRYQQVKIGDRVLLANVPIIGSAVVAQSCEGNVTAISADGLSLTVQIDVQTLGALAAGVPIPPGMRMLPPQTVARGSVIKNLTPGLFGKAV